MKTFTYKQANEILKKYFTGYHIIQVWDTIRELNILFEDAQGNRWELFTSGDEYFQRVEDFIIFELK